MDVKDYINKAHRQLIKDHYKNLNKSPTATNATLVNDTAQDSKQRNYSKKKLQMAWKCSQKFIKKPHVRPVVSSVSCHLSSISKHVEYHLQPIIKDMPSHVRNTKDFQNQIMLPKEKFTCDTWCQILIHQHS